MKPEMDTNIFRQIEENIHRLWNRIEIAKQKVGRQDPVELIAVSKTHPVEYIEMAREIGIKSFGENKAQELKEKASNLKGSFLGGEIDWHFIGSLQRNKAKEIIAYADYFQALDSLRLAEALDRKAKTAGRVLPCCVQVNVSFETTKSGISPQETFSFLNQLNVFQNLRIIGLMTIAEATHNLEHVRPQFITLRKLFDSFPKENTPIQLEMLSMGMSSDFEVAIEEGATHIRVGSAIFGNRDYQ